MTGQEESALRDARIAYAESLTEYQGQRSWYSKRAGELKTKAQRIDIFIIICGALVAALPVFKPASDVSIINIATSLLGAAVVIGQGLQRVYRYGETWPEYRRASERMKRDWRAFINAVPPFGAEDEDAARTAYIAALEHAIEEEQKLFFDGVTEKKSGTA
ncbi:MAG: DUF4231 domain-containing protein [Pseudomonadota bacterium]